MQLSVKKIEIGLGLGFRVFIGTFHAGFIGLLFVLIALPAVEVSVNFDRGQNQCHMKLVLLSGHHDATGKSAADPAALSPMPTEK
jgi:hypothetical protein